MEESLQKQRSVFHNHKLEITSQRDFLILMKIANNSQ